VRSNRVVIDTPALDEHFRFQERVEDFSVEQFVSQLSVERLDIAVLPGAARFDEQRLDLNSFVEGGSKRRRGGEVAAV
jgi:hypothetical protein